MNFEVNGLDYVLTYLPDEGSFALFERDDDIVTRMRIVHDDGPTFIASLKADDPERTPSRN